MSMKDISKRPDVQKMKAYFCEMANCSSLRSDEGAVLLRKRFERAVQYIPADSLLAQYWGVSPLARAVRKNDFFIFPFGANRSQMEAIHNAMEHPCSIIEGPPGTGKTQTVLNIIANLLIKNKSILIVSNNNSALQNVIDKLAEEELDFLSAFLGKYENKENFFSNQSGLYPNISSWECSRKTQEQIAAEICQLEDKLRELFEVQEQLAILEQQMSDFRKEQQHLDQLCLAVPMSIDDWELPQGLTFDVAVKVWKKIQNHYAERKRLPFWYRIVCSFFYHISSWEKMKQSPAIISRFLSKSFYPLLLKKLNCQREQLIMFLQNNDVKNLSDRMTALSFQYLRGCLFKKYVEKYQRNHGHRQKFNIKSYGWDDAEAFLGEYPVVLSTTFSSTSCIAKNNIRFDTLIMDEASQVDVVQGAMALTTSKNAVIVGDTKQLPNILTPSEVKEMKRLYEKYKPAKAYYNCEGNSFLASFRAAFSKAPSVVLREHYRCHPDIIGFCNERFYHGKLIVMTQDMAQKYPEALRLYRTSEGSHFYKHVNQRQIDVSEKEVLPELRKEVSDEEIGIIAPYRKQVDAMTAENQRRNVIDTVHKFQGREKEAILFVSTDDKASSFLEQPSLINVAVSRAKKKFWLIAPKDTPTEGSLFGELIKYMEYKNCIVIDSNIYSCFDKMHQLLTSDMIPADKKIMITNESPAEMIFAKAVLTPLLEEEFMESNFDYVFQYPLLHLFKRGDWLEPDEKAFIGHSSHVDFLVFSKVTHQAILGIEVDGKTYHEKDGIQGRRDRLKDSIFAKAGLPLYRFRTDQSSEIERLRIILSKFAGNVDTLSNVLYTVPA